MSAVASIAQPPAPVVFVDRDGTLIEEPADAPVDSLSKVRFMPGVFAALSELTRHGYKLVMVTNQDGLGGQAYPRTVFEEVQEFVLNAFSSQGIFFDAVLVCPHTASDGCACRKPRTQLVDRYLGTREVDLVASAVVGDRETDLELARNLALRGLRIQRDGTPDASWPAAVQELLARRCDLTRQTKETSVQVRVNLDRLGPVAATTGIGFFNHMLEQLAQHGGFALELKCDGDLKVDEHHTVEDSALALGEALRRALGAKLGIARYGFLLPMDESEAVVTLDLSGRAYAKFSGDFNREAVGGLPTELVPHFFRSLADGLRAAIHVEVKGENAHHMIEACFKGVGRSLRQAFRREGLQLPTTKGVL
jgi:imidazoleglycerol-phosphate dehydratase/histidinol-phosphatase